MKVTLKDIAEETGYSVSTVSRVLNNSDKISTKTAKEIYQSARRLNYPILETHNGKSSQRALKILLVITGFHIGEFYASMFNGMDKAAKRHNTELSLISIQKPFDEMLKSIKELSDERYEGLIMFAPEFDKEDYLNLKKILPEQFPVISNAVIENPVISTVSFDSYSGGFLAAEHFDKQGFKKCGIIKGPFHKAEARYRYNGFRDYIYQKEDMKICWNYQGNFSYLSGEKAFKAFQAQEDKPSAIFTSNDEMAHAFLNKALEYGYDVPENLALIGYDDLPICNRHNPTISSIHTDFEKLGMVTMEKMKEILKNPDREQGVLSLVPVSLKVRESSQNNSIT